MSAGSMHRIRKVIQTGNGSVRATIPKSTAREWGLIDENGDPDATYLLFEATDDDAVRLEPIS